MANMKKVFDERTKHRLVGVIVILALMIIFLPPMMRESDKNLDEFTSYQIPKKPPMPKVTVLEPSAAFRSVKTVSVAVPKMPAPVKSRISPARSLSQNATREQTLKTAEIILKKQKIAAEKSLRFNEVFTIQLASFNKHANAQALVKKLRAKGFSASEQITKTPKGSTYQVIVGQTKQRDQAIDLQKKLVDNTKLNGLIIRTKVG
ncbi:MAG: SPOR domain-containing protein [Gammaproteobacteria bacterium]